MQNQILNLASFEQIDQLLSLFLKLIPIIFTIYSIYYVRTIFKKSDEIEDNIFIVKAWLDNLEYIVLMQRGPVQQSVIDGITQRDSKPLIAELETLKIERQFLLDRVPLLGVFKK